ncbi:hypothetical protein D9758_003557 [Tetrapyrgos nigripes]|uniref:Uncharacterized protein n=1 Tax=Tetrapyrgos nigripes TaxID=182062 RepID=A0A8H5GVA7_9AGAR|nr:hypothetical protein D9758_003557 [Tetrapyrgos nigripes]
MADNVNRFKMNAPDEQPETNMSFNKIIDADADADLDTGLPTLAVEIICEIISYFPTVYYPYVPDSPPPQPNPGQGPDPLSSPFPFPFDFPSTSSYPSTSTTTTPPSPLDPLLQRTHVLKALSETCRELRDKCRPLLWENVVCGFGAGPTRSNKSGSAERELVALIELLREKKDLGGSIHSLLLPLPPSTSPKTLHAFASLLVNDLVNLRTLQIVGVTSPEFAGILSTTSSSSSPPKDEADKVLDRPASLPSLTSLLIDSSGHQLLRFCPNLVKVYVTFYTFECSNVGGYLSSLASGFNPFLFPFGPGPGPGFDFAGTAGMGGMDGGAGAGLHGFGGHGGGMGAGVDVGGAPVGPGLNPHPPQPPAPAPRNARVRRLADEMGLTRIPSFAYAFANANAGLDPMGMGNPFGVGAGGVGQGGMAGRTRTGPRPILTKEELERRRLRQVQLSVVRCIRESRPSPSQSQFSSSRGQEGHSGGSTIEFFQVGNPGIEEDEEMWVVESDESDGDGDGQGEGAAAAATGGLGVGAGVGVQRDDENRTPSPMEKRKPVEGSLIKAIVEAMPNLRRFPRLYVHPETPASIIPYILTNLPHLTYIHFHSSDPLDARTIGFIGVLTGEMGARARQVHEDSNWSSGSYIGPRPHPRMRGYEYTHHGLRQPRCEIEMQYRENSMVLSISPPPSDHGHGGDSYDNAARARRTRGTGTGTTGGGGGVDLVHMVNPFSMIGMGGIGGAGLGGGLGGLGGPGPGLGLGGNPYPNPNPNPNPFAHTVPHLANIPNFVPAPVPLNPNIFAPTPTLPPVLVPALIPVPVSMPIPGFEVRLPLSSMSSSIRAHSTSREQSSSSSS